MDQKSEKFQIKAVISKSVVQTSGHKGKILLASMLQFLAFFVVLMLTRSYFLSLAVYAIFIPGQIKFLMNLSDSKVESVFALGKNWLTTILIAFAFAFVSEIGFLALIFPAIIFWANYGMVFSVSNNGADVKQNFDDAKARVKGHRGKMATIYLIFLLIFALFAGFGMLVTWLFSLFMPMLTVQSEFCVFFTAPAFCHFGALLGLCLFLIFAMPVVLLTVTNCGGAIASDRLLAESKKQTKDDTTDVDGNSIFEDEQKTDDESKGQDSDDKNDNDGDDGNSEQYIF